MNELFDKIEKAASETVSAEQEDYTVDGLLHCGKCRTPKQGRYVTPWGVRTPFCLCKCETEKREIEKAERERLSRARELRRECFPEYRMAEWTFANDDRKNERVSNIMRNYADNFETMKKNGKGVLLYGKVGRGKSYIACCVGNALIDRGIAVLMTDFERIEREANRKFGERQKYYDELNKYPLLIIDDLGVERNSSYMNSIVYTVIENRVKAGLPIIVTTNLTSEELKNPAEVENQRIYSRLLGSCIPIEVDGDDRRREKLKDDWAEFQDILGY